MATRKKSASSTKSSRAQSGPGNVRAAATRRRAKTPSKKHKAAANRSRKTLVTKLKKDLQATKKTLKAATKAASAELKLAKAAAKAEMDVLKDQLAAAIKREEALRKLSAEKAKLMWKAGEQWERQQLAKLKQAFKKTTRSRG